MEKYFEVKNLCFSHYRKPLCLKDINFSVAKGDKILVLASKEMGKTTLLSALSGFEDSYIGQVLFNGTEVRKIDDKKKNFSFLPSDAVFFEDKTLAENLKFFCSANEVKMLQEEEIKNLCQEMAISYKPKLKMKKYSPVQKRALASARCKLKKPNIIFLDDQFESSIQTKGEVFGIYKNLFTSDETIIAAIGDDSFKNAKNLIKNLNFNKILYLYDAKMRFFNNFSEFEKSFACLDFFKFFEGDVEFLKCRIQRQDKFYNLVFDDCFFSLDEKFNKMLDTLKLDLEDEEDAVVANLAKDIDLVAINEASVNDYLKSGKFVLYSNIDGERLI